MKNSLVSAVVSCVLSLPGAAGAEILIRLGSGNWVGGYAVQQHSTAMPSIVLSESVLGNGGYLAQRALSWSLYKHPDKTTGLLLTDPFGTGYATATSSRQRDLRGHMARASAYRLGYFSR
jgi:hypothetical protein